MVVFHVSERLLMLHDGPQLEQSLKPSKARRYGRPRRREHHPDRDRLAAWFNGSSWVNEDSPYDVGMFSR
jgi:hypothetical protein